MILGRIMKKIEEDAISRLLFSFPLSRPLVTGRVRRRIGSGTVFVSGGAALDPEISAGFGKLGITVVQGYGITETSPVIAAESPGCRRLGTVGRVLEGVEVRIDSPNDERVGEILIRGPNVMLGYFKDHQATSEALTDGWYRTGDLGRLDSDGFLTICGRAKNLIVTPNGRNVYPEEVEREILKSPYVAEVVVYPHKTGPVTEKIRAMIYPDPEALKDYSAKNGRPPLKDAEVETLLKTEVSRLCEQLAAYKRVRKIVVRQEEFPKTTTRKIKRFEVGRGEGNSG
jgi:long-chain acyl-CoA synthetase